MSTGTPTTLSSLEMSKSREHLVSCWWVNVESFLSLWIYKDCTNKTEKIKEKMKKKKISELAMWGVNEKITQDRAVRHEL